MTFTPTPYTPTFPPDPSQSDPATMPPHPALLPTRAPSRHLKVLTIQSHVVSGFVGNKCATFPLQLLGLDTDAFNTVHFSNHTGYPVCDGSIQGGEGLMDTLHAMEKNGLVQHTHVLTGYIGSLSLLQSIEQVVNMLKQHNNDLVYVLDPVMGDHGRTYVPQELIPAFKHTLVPLATTITPNAYEAQILTGTTIDSVESGLEAIRQLHELGPTTVVITSMNLAGSRPLSPRLAGQGEDEEQEWVDVLASTKLPQNEGCPSVCHVQVPKIHAYFTGAGDLFSALLLAHQAHHPCHLAHALKHTLLSLQAILLGTAADAGPAAMQKERTSEVCKARELRLVRYQQYITSPPEELFPSFRFNKLDSIP